MPVSKPISVSVSMSLFVIMFVFMFVFYELRHKKDVNTVTDQDTDTEKKMDVNTRLSDSYSSPIFLLCLIATEYQSFIMIAQ